MEVNRGFLPTIWRFYAFWLFREWLLKHELILKAGHIIWPCPHHRTLLFTWVRTAPALSVIPSHGCPAELEHLFNLIALEILSFLADGSSVCSKWESTIVSGALSMPHCMTRSQQMGLLSCTHHWFSTSHKKWFSRLEQVTGSHLKASFSLQTLMSAR